LKLGKTTLQDNNDKIYRIPSTTTRIETHERERTGWYNKYYRIPSTTTRIETAKAEAGVVCSWTIEYLPQQQGLKLHLLRSKGQIGNYRIPSTTTRIETRKPYVRSA